MAAANFDRYNLNIADGSEAYGRFDDNVREDLSNMIYNIAPYLTPLMTGCGKGRARNTYSEWQTDDLHTVDPTNAVIDGADAGTDDSEKSTRIGNHCQISDKVIRISGRAEAVDTAGRRSEMGYQLAKAGKSIKRDMEAILTSNQGSVSGSSVLAAELGGLQAWPVTNYNAAGDGASGGWGTTTAGVIDAATIGTPRGLTETFIRDGMLGAYEAGGEPSVLMMAPAVKQRLSEYLFTSSARVATLYKDTAGEGNTGATATGAVDVFVTDFGPLQLVPNRFWKHNGTAPAIDYIAGLQMNMWGCLYLRSFRTNRLARTGDAENRQLIVDYSLRSNNEAANFIVADLDASAVVA